jgi:peptidoglycan/LPS O-acetylase OafA/YrhL
VSELATPTRTTPPNASPSPGRGFRPDIQGLRAIAVVMVVIYHLYPSLLPGGFAGVDVFFVISGYLITGHLWRGFAGSGRLSLVDFWGRRARRLIPAAALVLAVTWVASRIVLPAARLPDTAQQILASALYFQNWQLAGDSVNYLKSGDAASPVQHFWSLSVEEQFYLVWPLLFLAAAAVALAFGAARRQRARGVAAGVLTAGLVAGSLAYSVWYTRANPPAAYFVTTTRMWELGIGGLLALAPAGLTRLLERQGWLAWLGLAAVVCSAFTLSGASPFPGYLALLPVLGSAAMIAGGSAAGRFGPARLTSAAPMVFLGGISYSLYLWHYPVINLFTAWHGRAPGLVTGPVLAAVAVLLAWGTKVTVEDRVRLAAVLKAHPWRSVSTALAAVVPVALAAVFIAAEPPPWNGMLGPGYPGAAALAAKIEGHKAHVPAEPVLPPPAQVSEPGYWVQGCLVDPTAAAPKPCVYGDTKDPKLTVVLVGDSIAGNWWEALDLIAQQEHWKLIVELHSSCAFTAAPSIYNHTGRPNPACDSWGRTVLNDLITKVRPQLVIASSIATEDAVGQPHGSAASRAAIGAGEAAYWKQLQANGISVVAIRESPEPGIDAPACVEHYHGDNSRCDAQRSKAIPQDPPSATAVKLTGGTVPVIDMNDLVCGPETCPPEVGNVLVYFDAHHFTQAYSQTLAPYLKQRLLATNVVQTLMSKVRTLFEIYT